MTDDENRVAVARIKNYGQAYLWSLVLQSVNVPHALFSRDDLWIITVANQDQAEAVGQISSFEKENRNWPPPKEEPAGSFFFRDRQPPTVLFMGCLLVFYWITGPWQEHVFWFRAGAVNLEEIVHNGQWWRLVTALTLHADPVHVLGNVIIGGTIIHFLCKILGTGLGLFLVLFAGVAGNGVNVFFRVEQHLSVGFSTAVFGAIGILTGLELRRQRSLKGVLLPLGAGAGLLAMLGSSGERTDLGAHFWGLAVGCLVGFFVASFPSFFKWAGSWRRQLVFFALVMLVIFGSWQLAAV